MIYIGHAIDKYGGKIIVVKTFNVKENELVIFGPLTIPWGGS